MPTTYLGDETNNPTGITIPSDGDQPVVSSVNAALEGLFDKARYIIEGATAFTGNKTFTSATITALTVAGALITSIIPSAEHRLLVWRIPLGNSMYARFYARREVTAPQSHVNALEVTINASWDHGTSQWSADSTSKPARIYEFGGHNGAAFQGDDMVLRFKRKHTTSSAWAHDGWDLGTQFSIGGGNPTPTSGAVPANTYHSKAFPKAWGRIRVNGGSVSIIDGYGLASVIVDGTTAIEVELRNPMQNSNYAVVTSSMINEGAPKAIAQDIGTTSFDLVWPNTAESGLHTITSGTFDACFVVFGEHQS